MIRGWKFIDLQELTKTTLAFARRADEKSKCASRSNLWYFVLYLVYCDLLICWWFVFCSTAINNRSNHPQTAVFSFSLLSPTTSRLFVANQYNRVHVIFMYFLGLALFLVFFSSCATYVTNDNSSVYKREIGVQRCVERCEMKKKRRSWEMIKIVHFPCAQRENLFFWTRKEWWNSFVLWFIIYEG